MGADDERMLVQKFIDSGFGSFRYPQPAITMKKKYQTPDFSKVRRAQPVDFVANGQLLLKYVDGRTRKMPFRLGVEEKTTGAFSFVRSSVGEHTHLKFIEFCRKNCLVPAYIVIFRTALDYTYGFTIGNELPPSIRRDKSISHWSMFLPELLKVYISLYDEYEENFDVVECSEFEG